MTLFGSICEIAFISIVADFLYLAQVANGANEFRRCYNTSMDMHCFDVQYNSNNQALSASFENARKQCTDINSNLIIIKDEETNQIVRWFLEDPSNPIRNQYVWTDAYRVNDFNKTYRWQWLNSTLPNMSASDVAVTRDYAWYVASLEFKDKSFHLTAQQPHFLNSYICEYPASNCPTIRSINVRVFDGRCYIATNEHVSWYEARNRCLKGGGDLASFANVTSIDFTSWLVAGSDVRYWMGLRFARYIWRDSGLDVKFSKWSPNNADWNSSCLIVCFNCDPPFSWNPKDCNIVDSIYVVCHTVTSLITTTATSTTASTATSTVPTIPATDTTSLTTPRISQNDSSATSSESKRVAVGVGVGVGVGVPVIIAIVLIVICVIRRHRLKTPVQPPSTQAHPERFTTDDQGHTNGGEENSQYAFVPASLSSKPTGTWDDAKIETQYAPLDFPESDNSKIDKDHSPFDVL